MKKILTLVFFAAAMCVAASGEETSPARGLRVFSCAHSFHNFVPGLLSQVAKSAGIEDHAQLGVSSIGGSTVIQHWDVADEKNVAKRLLQEGRVDALTLSPIWFPDAGLEKFGELSLKHNPDIRIFVNEFWIPNDVYDPVYPLQTKVIVDHNAATIPELKKQQDLYCQDVQKNLNELNSKLGKNIFFMVPVGHAVVALREKIIAGQAPGLSAQQDLFRDNWGHPQVPVKVLAAYCFYACIYQRSPVGLAAPGNAWGMDGELVRLLQELAWDAVTTHPMTGLPVKE